MDLNFNVYAGLAADSALPGSLASGSEVISEWYSRGVTALKNVPAQMQQNQNVAIGVFAGANLIFLTVIQYATCHFPNKHQQHVNSAPQQTTDEEK